MVTIIILNVTLWIIVGIVTMKQEEGICKVQYLLVLFSLVLALIGFYLQVDINQKLEKELKEQNAKTYVINQNEVLNMKERTLL